MKPRLFAPVLLLASILFMLSCGTMRFRRIASFFFDGVPKTTGDSVLSSVKFMVQTESSDSTGIAARLVGDSYFYHAPYKEKSCSDCHKDVANGEMVDNEPALCYMCHDDYREKFKTVHGPVAAGYCTKCHNPHYSQNEKLLTRQGQQLCLYCHDQKSLGEGGNHEDVGSQSCTECHNPHGGDDRYMLK